MGWGKGVVPSGSSWAHLVPLDLFGSFPVDLECIYCYQVHPWLSNAAVAI